jgi:hypothetical protein
LASSPRQRAFALVYVLAHCTKTSNGFLKLKLGNLPIDGLPFGRSENGVLEDFPKDGNFFLNV